MGRKLSKFLEGEVTTLISINCNVHVYSKSMPVEFEDSRLKFTVYENNLPNCVIVDDRQMWISSDFGFQYDSGLTTCIEHPELIKQFKQILFKNT
ncbi:hypothetical protein [Companilactobacillus furfuricola]|uniref:hypothetical protein n=1 Tax=Companilactobacillus furfuricola TaxID=1462575 RepID=UPI000F76EA61|nr:hypothetical protein [Companilactobacillus furfuricola]